MKKKEILEEIEKQIKEEADKRTEDIEKQVEENESKKSEEINLSKQEEEEEKILDIGLHNLPGVGDITISKFKAMGIHDIMDVVMCNTTTLHDILGETKSMEYCTNLIISANDYLTKNKALNKPLSSLRTLLENEKKRNRFSTGDKGLDDFFGGGGIEGMAITELFGKFQVGKTQICDCVAVTAAANDQKVLFIDTENTFSPTRIQEITMERGLNIDKVLDNILVIPVNAAAMFSHYIQNLTQYVGENDIKVIIIDSIIALHRAEYLGRGVLADRQQSLSKIMGMLDRVAYYKNIAVLITNQVGDSPDPFKKDVYATGGNIIGHSSTHRVYLRSKGQKTEKVKGRNQKRDLSVIQILDSPRYPRTEAIISMGKDGVRLEDPSKVDSTD